MNSRSLRWTVLIAGMAVGALTWWASRPGWSQQIRVEPSTIEPLSAPAPAASLDADADPLALARAPAEQVAPVIQDTSVDAPSLATRDRLSILVIDRATRAPLAGMGVQMQWGPLERTANSNSMHGAGPICHTDVHGRVYPPNNLYEEHALLAAWDPAGHLASTSRELTYVDQLRKADIVLELSPENDFVLWMQVVDEESGDPVAGAHDSVAIDMSLPTPGGFPSYMGDLYPGGTQVSSNSNGLLLCSGPEWTWHSPHLAVPGHATVWVTPEKGHETADKALRITTPRSASVRIHVVDTAGLPVRDCKVSLCSESNQQVRPLPAQESNRGWGSRSDGITDASGYALIEGLPPHVELRGETSGVFNYRIPSKVKVEPGEVRNVEWVVAGGVILRGTLSDQTGAPIPDCEIWLTRTIHETPSYFDGASRQPDRRALTDASGRFVFAGTELGRFWVGPGVLTWNPESLRTDVAPIATVVDVVARAEMNVDLRAARGLYLRGHVIPPADKDLLDGIVVVEDRARGVTMRSPWKADGSFSVGPLTSGPQSVTAQSKSGHARSEPVVVEAGTDDMTLQLGAGSTVSGRVLDVNGGEVPCNLLLTVHGSLPSAQSEITWSTNGEFSFSGLGPGEYDLAAASSGMKLAVLGGVTITHGTAVSNLVLRLEPAGMVRVRDERTHGSCELQVEQRGVRIAKQKFEPSSTDCALIAPTGRVLVRRRNPETNDKSERTVEVEAGKITNVSFDE